MHYREIRQHSQPLHDAQVESEARYPCPEVPYHQYISAQSLLRSAAPAIQRAHRTPRACRPPHIQQMRQVIESARGAICSTPFAIASRTQGRAPAAMQHSPLGNVDDGERGSVHAGF